MFFKSEMPSEVFQSILSIKDFKKIIFFGFILLLASCSSGSNSGGNSAAAITVVNTPTISPGTTTQIIVTNTSLNNIVAPTVVLAQWLRGLAESQNLTYTGTLKPLQSYTFSFSLDSSESTIITVRWNYQDILTNAISKVIQVNSISLNTQVFPTLDVNVAPDPLYLPLTQDILINADLWSDKPEIMSAGYGFEGIEGVYQGESHVIAAGGAWECNVTTPNPPYRALTSAMTQQGVATAFGYPTFSADAMPIVFSWPVLPSTVNRKDFSVTLNTGESVTPYVASISPNLEFNERSTVVIFGQFGNRLQPGESGAVYPVNVAIVANLKLVGPHGVVSAVGLAKNSTNPYVENGGPTLVGAKLSVMSTAGEGIGCCNAFSGAYPNDGVAYYGESNAQYRLRIYTTGGFSPDGVAAVQPGDFSKFFRLQVTSPDGTVSWLTNSGIEYSYPQGKIEIVGLADLGVESEVENDAYVEDNDNYIDIVLKGDEAAMKLITAVEIPATTLPGYLPFFNPGGPGSCPTAGVIYTSPGPYRLQPVTMAIDNPLTVNYGS